MYFITANRFRSSVRFHAISASWSAIADDLSLRYLSHFMCLLIGKQTLRVGGEGSSKEIWPSERRYFLIVENINEKLSTVDPE